MKDDEFNIIKGSIQEKLIHEDLTVHSLETLNNRVKLLKSEINRTALAINEKQNARSSANNIFS